MPPDNHEKRKRERERKREYRSRHKTYRLSYTIETSLELNRQAGKYGKSVPQFIKAVVKAHIEGNGYVPLSENKVQDLVFQLRKVGNNLNQVVRHVNAKREVRLEDIEQMQNQLNEIENQVVKALTQPQEISEVLEEYLEQNPEKLQSLINWLNQYQT